MVSRQLDGDFVHRLALVIRDNFCRGEFHLFRLFTTVEGPGEGGIVGE